MPFRLRKWRRDDRSAVLKGWSGAAAWTDSGSSDSAASSSDSLPCGSPSAVASLLDRIERGELDPTRVITHRLPLAEAPYGYDIFKNKADGCEKVVLKP